MKLSHILLTVIIAAATAFGVMHFQKPATGSVVAVKETAYDRVMRTGTIRCGYATWPPLFKKDINTNTLSGLTYDFTVALAASLKLNIEWSEDIVFSTYLQDIATGRYDVECSGGWPNALRGKLAYYSLPYGYVPLRAIVRPDDARFDADSKLINSPNVRVVGADGQTSVIIQSIRFPQSQLVSVQQDMSASDQILNVVGGKADVALVDAVTAHEYEKSNPGTIKIITHNPPIHMIALTFTLPHDEQLRGMFDEGTRQLIFNGTAESLVEKNGLVGAVLLPSDVTRAGGSNAPLQPVSGTVENAR
jgi:ABC-type amino acid transport substrate-binding protein